MDKWTVCADDDRRIVVGYLILYSKEEICVGVMVKFDESGRFILMRFLAYQYTMP